VSLLHPLRSSARFSPARIPHSNPANRTPVSPQRHPWPWQKRHTAGFGSAAESAPDRAANQPGSGHGSAAPHPRNQEPDRHPKRQSRASPRRGQHPSPRLRKNSQNTPATGAPTLTLTRSRIAPPSRPETPAAATLLAGRDRRYCFFRVLGFISSAGSQIISPSALTSTSVGRRSSAVRFSTPLQLHCESHLEP